MSNKYREKYLMLKNKINVTKKQTRENNKFSITDDDLNKIRQPLLNLGIVTSNKTLADVVNQLNNIQQSNYKENLDILKQWINSTDKPIDINNYRLNEICGKKESSDGSVFSRIEKIGDMIGKISDGIMGKTVDIGNQCAITEEDIVHNYRILIQKYIADRMNLADKIKLDATTDHTNEHTAKQATDHNILIGKALDEDEKQIINMMEIYKLNREKVPDSLANAFKEYESYMTK
jgi:hypothetical protein